MYLVLRTVLMMYLFTGAASFEVSDFFEENGFMSPFEGISEPLRRRAHDGSPHREIHE